MKTPPTKPAGLAEELASKWIDDPKTEAESAWNAIILLYNDCKREMDFVGNEALQGLMWDIEEILGIFEDESQ